MKALKEMLAKLGCRFQPVPDPFKGYQGMMYGMLPFEYKFRVYS